MKIGILTFLDSSNHGTFSQAYALQRVLARRYNSVEVINYKNWHHELKELRCQVSFRNPRKTLANLLKYRTLSKYLKDLKLSGKRIHNSSRIMDNLYDVIVIGSDEVLNFQNPVVGIDKTYFGSIARSQRVILYAPSFGNVTFGTQIPSLLVKSLENVVGFSARDENSKKILSDYTDKEVSDVLDPTLLYDFMKETIMPEVNNYILVYSLSERFDSQLSGEIIEYAQKHKKQIISVGKHYDWCNYNFVNITSYEWYGYFAQADFIITTSFHGCIFSIKNKKQFITVPSTYKSNKILDLLKKFDIEERVYNGDGSFGEILGNKINYECVFDLIKLQKEASIEYLEQSLKQASMK